MLEANGHFQYNTNVPVVEEVAEAFEESNENAEPAEDVLVLSWSAAPGSTNNKHDKHLAMVCIKT